MIRRQQMDPQLPSWRNADTLFTHLMFVLRLCNLRRMLQCIWCCHCISFSFLIYHFRI